MNKNRLLTITSLVSLLLLTLHIVDDIVHGFDSAGLMNMIGIAVAAVLLYGTLMLRERLAGLIMMLFVNLFSAAMPILHLRSPRINEIAQASGGFFFIWTLWALGVIGIFGMMLAAERIWNLRTRKLPDVRTTVNVPIAISNSS